MRSPIACLCLALCAPAPARAAATETTPNAVVASIYAREIADETKGDATAFMDRDLRDTYFSKSFNGLITRDEDRAARAHDAGALDFDPVISGQDGAVSKLTVVTEAMAPERAVVAAHFVSLGQAVVVTYQLVRQDGRWVIDDIAGKLDRDRWSVRDILQRAKSEKSAPPPSSKTRNR